MPVSNRPELRRGQGCDPRTQGALGDRLAGCSSEHVAKAVARNLRATLCRACVR